LAKVDYVRAVEAVIPGVQGRVLGVLSRTQMGLTMRTVAELAGVSGNRANQVLNQLVDLGLVERREVGASALVSLVRDNAAAQAVVTLAGLWDSVVERMRIDARSIDPAPASLVLFGSFARRAARTDSDIDVLAVRARGVGMDNDSWSDTLRHWADRSTRLAGNPVNLLDEAWEDMPGLLSREGSVWEEVLRDGVLLAGTPLVELSAFAP
jgi:predicted nucleotidyltransferase